ASARAYAVALVSTVDYLCEARPALPPVASGFGHAYLLKRRLTMILRGTTPRALSWHGFLTVLGLGALLLPFQPTWAQDEAPRARQRADAEEQQQPPAGRGRSEADRAGTDRARAEVEKMTAELERMRAQMREMEQRLREAQSQLQNRMREAEMRVRDRERE